MRVKTLGAAIAIVFSATIGAVSAADQSTASTIKPFSSLKGVAATPMASDELKDVRGMDHHFTVTTPASGVPVTHMTDKHQDAIGANSKGANFFSFVGADGNTRLVSPAYHGLSQACVSNNVIDGPAFLC